MLYLYFANQYDLLDYPGFINGTDGAFLNLYKQYGKEQQWLQDSIVRECIQKVDRIPLGLDTLKSLLEAGVRPDDLCTGTKNIILCRFVDGVHRQARMGPNCYPYLFKIGAVRELYVGCCLNIIVKQEWLNICPSLL